MSDQLLTIEGRCGEKTSITAIHRAKAERRVRFCLELVTLWMKSAPLAHKEPWRGLPIAILDSCGERVF
jgi:hypothetical protein